MTARRWNSARCCLSSRGELADFTLLAIVAQVAELERRLTPSDFARLPSLRSLVEAARAVASELGYGDESRTARSAGGWPAHVPIGGR